MKKPVVRDNPWLLPFVVTGGLLLGCFLARVFSSAAMSQPGAPGDAAGAATALLLLICFSSGIGLSTATVIICRFFYHCRFVRFLSRFLLCFAGGAVIGIFGDSNNSIVKWILWCLVLLLPITLSLPSKRTIK